MASFLSLLGLALLSPAYAGDIKDDPAQCEIPIYVNLEGITPAVYRTYTRAIYDAAVFWNTANVGFRFQVVDWNYEGDRKEGAVVVSWTEIDPVHNKLIGYTYNQDEHPNMQITRSRVHINSTDNYCMTSNDTYCFQMFNVVAHELGHALGLKHNEDNTSVMKHGVSVSDKRFSTINEVDTNNLRSLFPADGSGCAGAETGFAWSKE